MTNECTCLPDHRVAKDENSFTFIAARMCDYCRDKERQELIRAQQDKNHV